MKWMLIGVAVCVSLFPEIHLLSRGALLLAIFGAYRALVSFHSRRAVRRYEEDLIIVLEELSRALRSGCGLREALEGITRSPSECRADVVVLLQRVDAGATFAEAIEFWRQGSQSPGVRAMSSALALTFASGGSPAHAVESAASIARDTREVEASAATHAAQAQASFWLLTALPVLLLLPMASADRNVRAFMFETNTGAALLFVGVALDLLGAFTMTKLVRSIR